MTPDINPAVVLTWACQHGTERKGYVSPIGSCGIGTDCDWKEKK